MGLLVFLLRDSAWSKLQCFGLWHLVFCWLVLLLGFGCLWRIRVGRRTSFSRFNWGIFPEYHMLAVLCMPRFLACQIRCRECLKERSWGSRESCFYLGYIDGYIDIIYSAIDLRNPNYGVHFAWSQSFWCKNRKRSKTRHVWSTMNSSLHIMQWYHCIFCRVDKQITVYEARTNWWLTGQPL